MTISLYNKEVCTFILLIIAQKQFFCLKNRLFLLKSAILDEIVKTVVKS